MLQVPKDKDVIRIFFSYIFILGGLVSYSSKLLAQNTNFEFQRYVIRNIRYPKSLKNDCVPTYANILIEISEKGRVEGIFISDSAPQAFKDEFNKIKSSIPTNLLDTIIKKKNLMNCGIIIPVFYGYNDDYCKMSFGSIVDIGNNYLVFNGKDIDELTYELMPIVVNMYKPVY